jgi:hypothetical protein
MKKNIHTSGSLLADPAGLAPEITAKAIRTMPPNFECRPWSSGPPRAGVPAYKRAFDARLAVNSKPRTAD